VAKHAGTAPRPFAVIDEIPTNNKAIMILTLQILLVLTSLALMALILLHRGKGGGLSTMFGGSMQSSLSGSSVVEKNLDRLTLFVAAIWVISIIGVGLLLKVGA